MTTSDAKKEQQQSGWVISVSGACASFRGREVIATLPSSTPHWQAVKERNRLERELGRMLYLS